MPCSCVQHRVHVYVCMQGRHIAHTPVRTYAPCISGYELINPHSTSRHRQRAHGSSNKYCTKTHKRRTTTPPLLDRDAWSMVKRPRQPTNEHAPHRPLHPHPPLPPPLPTITYGRQHHAPNSSQEKKGTAGDTVYYSRYTLHLIFRKKRIIHTPKQSSDGRVLCLPVWPPPCSSRQAKSANQQQQQQLKLVRT